MGICFAEKCVGGIVRVNFSAVSALVFSAMVLTGCGDDNNSFGPNAKGGNVVLDDGEGWIRAEQECIGNGCYDVGWIFKENGDLINITYYDDNWLGLLIGTWSTDGNQMTITYSDNVPGGAANSGACLYDISGNTLTMYDRNGTVTFTKSSGITSVTMMGKKRESIKLPMIQ